LTKTNAYRSRKIISRILEVFAQNIADVFDRIPQFSFYSRFFFFIYVSRRYRDTQKSNGYVRRKKNGVRFLRVSAISIPRTFTVVSGTCHVHVRML